MFLSKFSRVSRVPLLFSHNFCAPKPITFNRFNSTLENNNKENTPTGDTPINENKIPIPENITENTEIPINENTEETRQETEKEAKERRTREQEENARKEKEEKEKKAKARKELMFKIQMGFLAASLGGIGFLWSQGLLFDYLKQIEAKFDDIYFKINNPTIGWKYILLPPSPVKHYTIVIDFEDLVFIEGEGSEKRAKLRPYVDLFLDELSELSEIVVWASNPDFMIPEFIQKLQRTIPSFHFFLSYAECTAQYGHVIKDLHRLNRPLSNVVNIVSSPFHCAYQPENALFLPHWDGNDQDTTLLDAYVCLRSIFTNYHPNSTDVRKLLVSYASRDASEANRREDLYPTLLQHHEVTKKRLAAMRKGM